MSAGAVAPGHELRFLQDGKSRVLKVQPRLATTTNESAVTAAVTGFGLTQQMLYKVAEPLARGELQQVLGDFEPPPLPVHVLHREGRYASRRVRAFLDLAIERLRALQSCRPSAAQQRHVRAGGQGPSVPEAIVPRSETVT